MTGSVFYSTLLKSSTMEKAAPWIRCFLERSFCLLLLLLFSGSANGQGWKQVTGFGTNPGDLSMYRYLPKDLPDNAPLVVVLHGCSQNAADFADESGWNLLADRYGFATVFPEQKTSNNTNACFNWFSSSDQVRGEGEALSIRQMVSFMNENHPLDTNAVYVTGLSAGGAMAAVMAATYPDLFRGAAVMAGLPYKSATNAFEANNAMNGNVDKPPDEWETLVYDAYTGYNGPYPSMMIVQGTADNTVDPVNATELMEQWTAVHNMDQTPEKDINGFVGVDGVHRREYGADTASSQVHYYSIRNMGHGIAVNPGSAICRGEGGQTGSFSLDEGWYSSFWAARFFDLIPVVRIEGPEQVFAQEEGLVWRVKEDRWPDYQWEVPAGANIKTGQGTDSIVVDWGSTSGSVRVKPIDSTGCKGFSDSLSVTVTTGVEDTGPGSWSMDVRGYRGQVRLSWTASRDLRIRARLLDMRGRELDRVSLTGRENRLELGKGLTPGLYHLLIVTSHGVKRSTTVRVPAY